MFPHRPLNINVVNNGKSLKTTRYLQLDDEVVKFVADMNNSNLPVNRDSILRYLRYAVSQLFAGAILVEQSSAILINCVEPYGRLKSTYAPYEGRTAAKIHLSSYPEKESKYSWITVVQVQEDNATKLKIGATAFNLLVTSNLRLGKSSSSSI
ncbi:hypothetical protein RO3G_08448 [Rhizopus delemar RA 99-880]|uniref:Uncharacterized protein n=1 Tax=Rhizopus delemar (strain RA 99-880 / ATCC MYA-4621 / FGSC 9543 / NRRL 43880) TaxID=246409 RepID=I1C5L3_RHIO9|nr:hypothetical protein RO3G_08448 [Rhizopus delemar RA 99-880]|eukprot:EIE83743.1 hypothetical protein RO3G_08448 [Rhizopus delemar RA 99-880]